MSEHYRRGTTEAPGWCKICWATTQHRVDGVLLGPCLPCLQRPLEPQKPRPDRTLQGDLFPPPDRTYDD